MTKQYGIVGEPSSYSSHSSKYEMGWAFTTNIPIYFMGFRVKFPASQTVVAHLWDDSTRQLLYTSDNIVVDSSNSWVEHISNEPILLEAGKTYVISTYNNSTRYYSSASNFTFNTDYIKYVTGRFISSKNSFPSNNEDSIYPIIDLIFTAFVGKYLVSSEDKYYTVINNELSEIPVEGTLTASIFEKYGVDEISSDLLKTLVNPRLYAWSADSTIKCGCNVTATPKTQIIYSDKCDLTAETILGVENIESIFEGSPLLAMSFDEKQTWEAYNGTKWIILSEDNTGSLPNIYEGLTIDQWAEKLNGINSIYFRVVIHTAADKVTSIKLNFLN